MRSEEQHTEAGVSVEGGVFQVSLREIMSKAKCEGHYWHVSSSTVMCFYGVGGARGVRAKAADVIITTTFVGCGYCQAW